MATILISGASSGFGARSATALADRIRSDFLFRIGPADLLTPTA